MNRDKVLFVDDDERILSAWRRSFSGEPYEGWYTASSSRALEICREMKVSVLVSDYQMPGLNGGELFREVKQLSPKTIKVLVSGHATLAIAKEMINDLQLFRLFEKPTSVVDLGISVREAVIAFNKIDDIKSNSAELIELEGRFPGISKVTRDASGSIICIHE